MKSLKIFSLLSLFAFASSQSISCTFATVNNRYRCTATIDNPTGNDLFSGVHGFHNEGKNNFDVEELQFSSGTTTIIPRVICDTFVNLQVIYIRFVNLGIKKFTENAFISCTKLVTLSLTHNPIIEIHPNFLRYNTNLDYILLADMNVTTLPEPLFSSLTKLTWLEISFNPSLTDLPPLIFQNNLQLASLRLHVNRLEIWRPEWFQKLTKLTQLSPYENYNIKSIPRNAVNAPNLRSLFIDINGYKEVDYFMFNEVRSLSALHIGETPVEAIDFNLIDRATGLTRLLATNCSCTNRDFTSFNLNRAAYMVELEPCFDAFDRRTLSFTTSGTASIFNSVRKEEIYLQVQTASDAIITFSTNPDGSGSNFEVHLSNVNSCIYENGVQAFCRSTSGLLNATQWKSFNIQYENGDIYVAFENDALLFAMLDNSFPVRFFGVRTKGANASWVIHQVQT